jgi:hypothetical protein
MTLRRGDLRAVSANYLSSYQVQTLATSSLILAEVIWERRISAGQGSLIEEDFRRQSRSTSASVDST